MTFRHNRRMERGISSLIFIIILLGLAWYFWLGFTPYYFHDVTPNVPMQTVIGNKAWYFPMGYIDPHYPNGSYMRGSETEVWLSLDARDFKIIPQDVAKQTFGLDRSIDVILSSDRNPQTKKAMQEFNALQRDLGTFQPADYGLHMTTIGNETEYVTVGTRISCGGENCTLFTIQVPDVRTAIVFNKNLLPHWHGMIEVLTVELRPFRQKPNYTNIFKDFFTQQPTGTQRVPTDPNSQLIAPGQPMNNITVPTLNTR